MFVGCFTEVGKISLSSSVQIFMSQIIGFSPEGQLYQAMGFVTQTVSKNGQLLPQLRWVETGRIFEHARVIGDAAHQFPPLEPLTALVDVVEMGQIHRGFQRTYRMIEGLERNLGVLQTTTTVIGAGVAVSGVLTAVNLYQTMKLRDDVQQHRKEVVDGFLDLRTFLREEFADLLSREIVERIYEKERWRELRRAYAQFVHAKQWVGQAIACEDSNIRNQHLANAIQTMQESLALYNDPHLLGNLNAPGQLRRMECSWTIEQSIALTYQLQSEPGCASKCLSNLQKKIRQDALSVVAACQTEDELDFLFPELTRIHYHDMQVLEAWQTQIDLMRSLSPRDKKRLAAIDQTDVAGAFIVDAPKEDELYQSLKTKAHFKSLTDQLRFMISAELRQQYEAQIQEQAPNLGYPGIVPDNWQQVSDLTVANLYWYLQAKAS
jgi:hypothetical protein